MKSTHFHTALKAALATGNQNLNEKTLKQFVEEDEYLNGEDLTVLEVVSEAMEVYTEQRNDEREKELREIKEEFKNHSHVDGEVKTPSEV